MEKTFKEIVNEFNKTGLDLGKVAIACELACREDISLNDDDFEKACDYLYDYYIHSDIGSCELVGLFICGLNDEEFIIDDCVNNIEKVDEVIYNLM